MPMLRAAIGFAAVVLLCLSGTGCASDGEGFSRKGIFSDWGSDGWVKVKTPDTPRIPPAHLETAQKVETLGRRIIAQNTFTGIEPMFYAIGVEEPVLFHRGAEELFISEGLVKKCRTEDELAAVLCSELGQMMAEKRGARRVGGDRDGIPEAALPGGGSHAGGFRADPGYEAEIAFRERREPRGSSTAQSGDNLKLARDLMKGAGYDPADLDRVEPLLRQSDRGAALRKQMSSSAAAPKWDR
jgi:hypothetical protein